MSTPPSLAALKAFAEEQIAANKYPGDIHTFRSAQCSACGLTQFEVTIHHHTGSSRRDFKGVISIECANCGHESTFLSFTGPHRKPEKKVRSVCSCGSSSFLLGECERIEGDEGIPGFFDEGVIVGQCQDCSRFQTFVFTD